MSETVEQNTRPAVELSDEALTEKAKDGSKAAYEELVRRYMRGAYSFAYQIVGDVEVARDLSQDVFIKIYQSLDTYKSGSRFFPWFYRILRNHCLNYKRRGKIISWLSLSDDHSMREAEQADMRSRIHEDSIEENEYSRVLHKAMTKLPEKQRMVVILHGIEGLSQKETAEVLGITEGTVRSRFFYAREHLQKIIKGIKK